MLTCIANVPLCPPALHLTPSETTNNALADFPVHPLTCLLALTFAHHQKQQSPTHPTNKQPNREYLVEYNDTLATLLLSSVTQSLNGLSELTDKFGVAFERTARRGRGGTGGMMMASMYGM